MEVLYPLVRALKIDAREIFNPEISRESPSICQLRLLIEECSEEEAAAIIPVFQSVLSALRDKNATPIKWNGASFPLYKTGKLALRSGRPAHLLSTIFNFTMSIRISFLHLGQYSGNFTSTVSSYTFVLVFPPQIGQCTHKEHFWLSVTISTSNNTVALRWTSGFGSVNANYHSFFFFTDI